MGDGSRLDVLVVMVVVVVVVVVVVERKIGAHRQ